MTIFERLIAGELPAHFVYQDDCCVAFMDINPMSPGHVLVVPRLAVATLIELDSATRQHLLDVAVRIGQAQRLSLGSLAQHVMVNDGKAASQSVPHVHFHVIPRYRGDTLKAVGHILLHFTSMVLPQRASAAKQQRFAAQAEAISASLELQ